MLRAYLNGKLIPASEAVLPVHDAGFVLGATVAEQVRTFRGRLFRLEQHLQRLAASSDILGVKPGIAWEQLAAAAAELAHHNHQLQDPDDDLGMSIFVTPGPYATMAAFAGAAPGPTVCMHTYPLPFHIWADKYGQGQALTTTAVEQVPTTCWPAALKCRSRMHYYLADRQAALQQPGSRALMRDHEGHVLEASTASVFLYCRHEGLVAPPVEQTLPSVSLSVVAELAASFGVPLIHRHVTLDDLFRADEVMLCSTSPCVWPAVQLNRQPVGGGRPGEMFRRLLAAWSELVGVDIERQTARFAERAAAGACTL